MEYEYLNKLAAHLAGSEVAACRPTPAAAFRIDGQRMAVEVDSPRNLPGGMMLVKPAGG